LKSAHVGFDDAVKGLPVKAKASCRRVRIPRQVIEHIRIAQHDISTAATRPTRR
jgi:hypothetical protein